MSSRHGQLWQSQGESLLQAVRDVLIHVIRCATQPTPLSSELREQWSKIWSANLRSISSAQQSRAACHLLCVMLRSCLVEQNELADCLDMLTSGGGVNHPAVLCDSSLAFWTAFQQSLILNKPGGSAVRCHNEMIRWVVNKWTPSIHFRFVTFLQAEIDLV